MVQTLATLLMTYKSHPTLSNCGAVSLSLHKKFKCLGDESSEVSFFVLDKYVAIKMFFRVPINGSSIPRRRM